MGQHTTAGRRRDPRIDEDVLTATLTLLDEKGYVPLSIGEVARRADVHRPAIYRRWPSKQHLVVDALASTIGVEPTPDTGDLRQDLITGISTITDALNHTVLGRVLPALIADLADDGPLRQRFLDVVFHARRATTARTLEHAMARGEARTDIDLDFVLDALAAPLYFRALFLHLPLDRTLVERTVDMVLHDILN
ncbi:TetR/AcrR family transcriptional regulator [Streptomyces sp. MK37H]|uniref:TetR/AcrR family transcriptional regulator n=1 Tax=Streptomyces sp. MK37H TaxID=2699117 RepID=UPI001B38D17B|nr:TetR/AcrR family transcriptional regulator [Streptomyces sp. MK37H]MBP8534622.1 TetR family transcriptional regulator [Streptomyces sp. MK37H]